jgi:hypothetical protein
MNKKDSDDLGIWLSSIIVCMFLIIMTLIFVFNNIYSKIAERDISIKQLEKDITTANQRSEYVRDEFQKYIDRCDKFFPKLMKPKYKVGDTVQVADEDNHAIEIRIIKEVLHSELHYYYNTLNIIKTTRHSYFDDDDEDYDEQTVDEENIIGLQCNGRKK